MLLYLSVFVFIQKNYNSQQHAITPVSDGLLNQINLLKMGRRHLLYSDIAEQDASHMKIVIL